MAVRRWAAAAIALLLVPLLAACSPAVRTPSSATSGPVHRAPTTTTQAPALSSLSHVFVVVMENLGASQALGTAQIAAVARRYAYTTAWYAASHPSLPNYLALASGSTWGVTSDCTSCIQSGADLGAQLSQAGVSWGAYFENMPSPCYLGPESPDGLYAQKHDPFAYFADIRSDPALCAHLQPFTALPPLLSGPATAVPRFVWVTPNLCDSGHDCSPSAAGAWLERFVSEVTASSAWQHGGLLVVTWDEGGSDAAMDPQTGTIGSSGGGGTVLGIVAAPGAQAGGVLPGPYDHYSVLKTVEEAFGLPLLGAAAAPAVAPLSAFLGSGG